MKSAYEWAEYEDGTLIEIGDWVDDYDGVPQQVRKIVLTEKKARIYLKPRGGCLTSNKDNKVKRSADVDTQDCIKADADQPVCSVDYIDDDGFHLSCGHTIEGVFKPYYCSWCGKKVE